LTSLPVLRYSSGHRKGRLKILYAITDLRVTKRFVLDETKNIEVMWEMFNLFNTRNLTDYNGNRLATTYGQARAALPPFRAQLGMRVAF
jgi:hypothetical protein